MFGMYNVIWPTSDSFCLVASHVVRSSWQVAQDNQILYLLDKLSALCANHIIENILVSFEE